MQMQMLEFMVSFRLVPGEDASPNPSSEASDKDPWKLKTSNYTALPSDKLLIDTTGGSWTLTLPASPILGQEVDLLGAVGLDKNPLYINPGQIAFEGKSSASVKFAKNDYLKLAFAGSEIGWVTDTDKIIVESMQTQPQPTPKPEPIPAPEPGPTPNPEPTPKPEPTPAPEPGPTPNPEPTPAPATKALLLDKYPGAGLALSLRQLSIYSNQLYETSEKEVLSWRDQSQNKFIATRSDSIPPPLLEDEAIDVSSGPLFIPDLNSSQLVASDSSTSLFIVFRAKTENANVLLSNNQASPSSITIFPSYHDGILYWDIGNYLDGRVTATVEFREFSILSLLRSNSRILIRKNSQTILDTANKNPTYTPIASELIIGGLRRTSLLCEMQGAIKELIIYNKFLPNYEEIEKDINNYYKCY